MDQATEILARLDKQHAKFDKELRELLEDPNFDEGEAAILKKKKLQLKDKSEIILAEILQKLNKENQ